MDKDRLAEAASLDPMANKDKLNERPILMLHGDSDTSVPIESQRFFIIKCVLITSKARQSTAC